METTDLAEIKQMYKELKCRSAHGFWPRDKINLELPPSWVNNLKQLHRKEFAGTEADTRTCIAVGWERVARALAAEKGWNG